ncbi:hypothetical protein LV84_01457 [Algoriphagus ratkowskyi]|uniref:Uncharacterized protein n=1 Tax=Algoriphagus ratkowskyi TaxID=57028 RepID=A0A2W7RB93_9BACT|nr:hypothetical protein LV84_01457 [Algoriphagus ratkowskyi]
MVNISFEAASVTRHRSSRIPSKENMVTGMVADNYTYDFLIHSLYIIS